MEEQILKSINNDDIDIAMQLLHNVKTKENVKCEILARMNLDGCHISPEKFIPLAKEHNIYHKITRSVVSKSFKYMDCHREIEEFSININMLDLSNEETIAFLLKKIDEYNIASRLVFELTEDEALTKDIKFTQNIMQKFIDLGCKFALDDFGKGYATFDPLLNFNFNYIKLDAVLCKNFLEDERKFYLINLLSEYAERIEILIIAEHIETVGEYKALKYMDIDYIQGYYIDKPTLINH